MKMGTKVITEERKKEIIYHEKWVKISELVHIAKGITPGMLKLWCKEGRIKASKRNGGKWWIDMEYYREMNFQEPEGLFEVRFDPNEILDMSIVDE